MFTYIFISLTILTTPIADLNQSQNYNLNQVLKLALKHNRSLKEANLKIKQSIAIIGAVKSKFDTVITGGLTLLNKKATPIEGNPFSITEVKQYGLKFGASKFLQTGGMVSIEASSSKQDQTMRLAFPSPSGGSTTPSYIDTNNYNNSITLVIHHHLLQGFGIDINDADIKKAGFELKAKKLTLQAEQEVVVRDIINSYWDLVMAWKQFEVLKNSLKIAKNQVKLTQSLVRNDFAKPSDLLAVQANVAQREGDILLAKTAILMASTKLKNLMGLKLDKAPFVIKPTSDFRQVDLKVGKKLLKQAVERSKNIKALQKQIEAMRQDEIKADNAILPKLDLQIAAGPSVDDKTFSDSFKRMLTFDAFTVSVGLDFQYSIGMNAAKNNLQTLKIANNIIGLQKENISSSLVMAAINALDAYESSAKRIKIAKLAVQLAQKHLDIEMALFKAGRGTNHSVLLRMQELDQAKLSYQKALRDKIVAFIQIKTLSGSILKEYGLSID